MLTENIVDLELSSLVFDRSHPSLQRDRIGPVDERSDTYDNRYDFATFIYDAYYDNRAKEVVLICPSLLNFKSLMEQAEIKIDGTAVEIRAIQPLSRGNVVRFSYPTAPPKTISFKHDLFEGTLKINTINTDVFEGKNAVYAISKDNDLSWMQDWLKYYVAEHGANAVVIFDNASTAYSMEELKETLSSVEGIEAVGVVRAWFPFGPGGGGKTNFTSKFLHMTMVELGRRQLLSKARAVLNVDIDELVYSTQGRSIFDATVQSENGYVRFNGQWVYADLPPGGQLIRHADHKFVRSDGLPKVNRKYCVAPTGPLAGKPWLTHRIISRKDITDPEFGFWHFRRLTNNWDYNREDFDPKLLVDDNRLKETMERVFSLRR